jgi:hypothetical protein
LGAIKDGELLGKYKISETHDIMTEEKNFNLAPGTIQEFKSMILMMTMRT